VAWGDVISWRTSGSSGIRLVVLPEKRIARTGCGGLCTVTVPVGLGLGRIGNFINGELYGRATDVPWAMVFPHGGDVPRHPSQLYEAVLEGLVLFLILWFLRKKDFRDGMMVVFFLLFYGIFRFFIEFFREPDPQLGLLLGQTVSMGQILCFSMMAAAGVLAFFIYRRQ
jgi:phosphatidylglycerol---prolipoprotein diacylglyceryl transferase